MAYRQTNTLRPTEEQFKELFDLNINAFWKHQAYTWYDPKLTFDTPEEFRDAIVKWSLEHTKIYQMWWEDDTLLGFRAFLESNLQEDFIGGMVHTAGDDGPIPKIVGDDPDWKLKCLKTDIFLGKPDSTGNKQWYWDRPEITPIWNNNDGESLWEAMHRNGYERAYSCVHGSVQKQMLWENRHKLTGFGSAHDIWLQNGYSFNERRQLGFDLNEQTSFVYRLIGGESLGWPKHHALYHLNNTERPDKIERPYILSIDEPIQKGIKEAPIPPEQVD
tara:strand:- start:240 stop:1064 length:825 start_codon:yes stop_codon:yes gene_type:complete